VKDVGTFYVHLVYFNAISYSLWHFVVILVYFPRFGMLYQEKSGNPDVSAMRTLCLPKSLKPAKTCNFIQALR
jgi:hypothetical protein